MTIPRGFTRCDDPNCIDGKLDLGECNDPSCCHPSRMTCDRCSGSGLVPTEKLREDVTLILQREDSGVVGYAHHKADAILARVAEHIREGR